MSNKKTFIFIALTTENDLRGMTAREVDDELKMAENNNYDPDFTIIGKIAEPEGRKLPIDFDERAIQWYDGEERDPIFLKKAVSAIVTAINRR